MPTDDHPAAQPGWSASRWARFWNRGGWWRAALITVAYAALYQGIGYASSWALGDFIDYADPTGSPASALAAVALPIMLGGFVLLAFAWSVGWERTVFRRQPVPGHRWMWLAVILVAIPIGLRVAATTWSAYSLALVLSILVIGVCVGFTEELLARGINVTMLRAGGHAERGVLVISSALFALLHSTNVFSGQPILTVAITVVYTFGFGAMMYLSLRATGSLIWPMLLHAATDPTTILATGGVDAHGATAGVSQLIGIAAVFNYLYVIFAVLAIIVVRDRLVAAPESSHRPG